MRWKLIVPALLAVVFLSGGRDNEVHEGGDAGSIEFGVDPRPEFGGETVRNHWGTPTPSPSPVPTPTPVATVWELAVPPPVEPTYAPVEVSTPHVEAVAVGAIEAEVCTYDWDCGMALSIMRGESGGNPSAWNDWEQTPDPNDGVCGLFQLAVPLHNGVLAMFGDCYNASANIAAAYWLYQQSGGWCKHWFVWC